MSPATGTVLDPQGITISLDPGDYKADPAAAFDGTNYLVTWEVYLHSPPFTAAVYGARVTPTGTVLDPSGIAIATASGNNWGPALAFDGSNYLVTWLTDRDGTKVNASRVDPAGQVLDPGGLVLDRTAPSDQNRPAVAFDGTNYFVVWQDYRSGGSDIYGARLTEQGDASGRDGDRDLDRG